MKKILIVLLVIIGTLLLLSCGEDVESEISRLDELKLQYDEVGQQHNLQLDQMLSVYRSQSEIHDRVSCERLADDYFVNSGNIAEKVMKLIENPSQLSKALTNSDVVNIIADSIEVFSKYPEVFDPMTEILDSQLSVSAKIEELECLYLLVDKKVENVDDKESLMNGLSTTIHSLAYWDVNFNEWQDALNGSLGKATLGIVGIIGITDGIGAVIGTLEGIRDTYKGQEGRLGIIAGRAVGEAAKTSVYAAIAILL